MKKAHILLVLVLLVGLNDAKAEEIQQQRDLKLEKQQLAWAISILAQAGALKQDQDSKVHINPDLIEMLKRENLLSKDGAETSSVCPDSY